MIITPDFVFISNPRAGSTFARRAIKIAYSNGLPTTELEAIAALELSTQAIELILPIRRGLGLEGEDHHGTYSQIPSACTGSPVVSTVRNPFSLMISNFEFSRREEEVSAALRAGLEPDSDVYKQLETYLHNQERRAELRWGMSLSASKVGPMSAHFLQMFSHDPECAFAAIRKGASHVDLFSAIPDISFVRQERLRHDLCEFLKPFRDDDQLQLIRTLKATHVTRRSNEWAMPGLIGPLAERIAELERFLFDFLRSRRIDYTATNAAFSQSYDARR